jgi:hypothetical protein
MLLGLPSGASAATFTPSTNLDSFNNADGNCSLREALQSINDGAPFGGACVNTGGAFGTNDTIALTPGVTYMLTVATANEDLNATGDLDVTNNVTIVGDAATPPTIREDANGDRVLDVPGADDLTVRNLIVSDGDVITDADNTMPDPSQLGGNIRFRGQGGNTLLLDNVDVIGGVADTNQPGDAGGGIAADSGGQVTIQNTSLVQGNIAGPLTGNTGFGGGIHIGGNGTDLTISNGTVNANDAGVGDAMGGVGGGINMGSTGTAVLNLTNATITNNRAGGDSTNATIGQGGGIALGAGSSSTVTISGGSISGNTAGGGAGNGNGFGGGLFIEGATAPVALNGGVTVSNNKAGGNGGTGNGTGGGIFTSIATTVGPATITGNTAGINDTGTGGDGRGGGISVSTNVPASLTVTNSTISQNMAGESQSTGGGIEMGGSGSLTISDSTIRGNSAGQAPSAAGAFGGGVGRIPFHDQAPVDLIERTTIADNTTAGAGFEVPHGAGLAAATRGTLTIRQSTIFNNTATGVNGTTYGGGLMLLSSHSAAGTFSVENSTITGNTATGADGGNGGGIATGRPLVLDPPAPQVTITHSTVTNNTAVDTGGPDEGLGGNLYAARTDTDKADLRASILTDGTGDAMAQNCAAENLGMFESLGENVEKTTPTQCELVGAMGDQIGVDPLLAALSPADGGDPANGVPTATRALMPASPAIDSVDAGCPPPAVDQRGLMRPFPMGGACDAGSYELQDLDGDGLRDTSDNCPNAANALQENNDADAQGDVCDPDDDNDTILDTAPDNCQFIANTDQADNDGDGIGNVCDPTPNPPPAPPSVFTPPVTTTPTQGEDPQCAALRAKLKKAKSKAKKRKIRKRLRKLGC